MLMTRQSNRRHTGCCITHYFVIPSGVSRIEILLVRGILWPVIEPDMVGVALEELNSSFQMQIPSTCMVQSGFVRFEWLGRVVSFTPDFSFSYWLRHILTVVYVISTLPHQ